MQVDIKNLPKSEFLLSISLSPEEFEKYENETLKSISEQVDIPGYRPGKAPKAFVIAHVGKDVFLQKVIFYATAKTLEQAFLEKKLSVISRPQINVISDAPLHYEARVAVFPEIKLKAYEKIKIPDQPITITDEEINEVIEEMRKYRATYKPLERDIQKGDRVEIDFQGYDEKGEAIAKTQSKNHPLFVGQGSLVEGFEEQLIGMKLGEKKRFSITFPQNFHSEPLRGKKVQFETEIKRSEEAILPQLDEQFVEAVMGEKKSVSQFHQTVKTDLHRRKSLEARRKRENELLEKLLLEASLEVPPLLIEEEIDFMIDDLKRQLESQGGNFTAFLSKLEKEKRNLRKEYAAEAEKRIRLRLILHFLFREMNITVGDSEMQLASSRLIESSPDDQKQKLLKDFEMKGELYVKLKNNLMLEKLFVKFLE